jgi:hypothetical protein
MEVTAEDSARAMRSYIVDDLTDDEPMRSLSCASG